MPTDDVTGVPEPGQIPSAISVAAYHAATGLVRESQGKNRSPVIDAMEAVFGLRGQPYCAIGVSAGFLVFWRHNKPGGHPFYYSASSQYIKRMAASNGELLLDPQALLACKGALGGWTDADGAHGHVFFIERRLTNTQGVVVAIGTVEYNTNLIGDRDGEGCYRLVRRRASDGLWYAQDTAGQLVGKGHKLWFVDVSDEPGGQWWQ